MSQRPSTNSQPKPRQENSKLLMSGRRSVDSRPKGFGSSVVIPKNSMQVRKPSQIISHNFHPISSNFQSLFKAAKRQSDLSEQFKKKANHKSRQANYHSNASNNDGFRSSYATHRPSGFDNRNDKELSTLRQFNSSFFENGSKPPLVKCDSGTENDSSSHCLTTMKSACELRNKVKDQASFSKQNSLLMKKQLVPVKISLGPNLKRHTLEPQNLESQQEGLSMCPSLRASATHIGFNRDSECELSQPPLMTTNYQVDFNTNLQDCLEPRFSDTNLNSNTEDKPPVTEVLKEQRNNSGERKSIAQIRKMLKSFDPPSITKLPIHKPKNSFSINPTYQSDLHKKFRKMLNKNINSEILATARPTSRLTSGHKQSRDLLAAPSNVSSRKELPQNSRQNSREIKSPIPLVPAQSNVSLKMKANALVCSTQRVTESRPHSQGRQRNESRNTQKKIKELLSANQSQLDIALSVRKDKENSVNSVRLHPFRADHSSHNESQIGRVRSPLKTLNESKCHKAQQQNFMHQRHSVGSKVVSKRSTLQSEMHCNHNINDNDKSKQDKSTMNVTEFISFNPTFLVTPQAETEKALGHTSNHIVEPKTADKDFFMFADEKAPNTSPNPDLYDNLQFKLDCQDITPPSGPRPRDYQPAIDHKRNVVQLKTLREVKSLDPLKKED